MATVTRYPVITVGREYGSSGRAIARIVAEKYGIAFYDYESIAAAAAERAGIDEKVFKNSEENVGSPLKHKLSLLGTGRGILVDGATALVKAQEAIIKSIADNEPAVIVGRCADHFLKDYAPTVNIFIAGTTNRKIKWVMKNKEVNEEDALEMMRTVDKRRASFYRYNTEKAWGQNDNYDLRIKLDNQTNEEAADIIKAFVDATMGKEIAHAKEVCGK
ncbi:MAG: cytidylate kinase-like family protein [Oscillospiraceae bacterium]|nr:cytidylate kinase-like family protein [Oscillospiraceae bacterium]